MKKALLSIALLTQVALYAQTPDYKWGIGLNAGLTEYYGEMGNGFFKFDLNPHTLPPNNSRKNQPGYISLNVSKYQTKSFDFNLSGGFGEWGYYKDASNYFYRSFQYADVTARWKFLGKDYARFTP